MVKALRIIGTALVFAAAIIGASWVHKGLWYQNYIFMGLNIAFIMCLSCEAACGSCCAGQCKAVTDCK